MLLRFISLVCHLTIFQQQVKVAISKNPFDLGIESIASQEELVRRKASQSDEPFYGVLHSKASLDYWTAKEEEIAKVLEKRLELIDEEIGLIEEYLEDYDESTGEAMRHLREPKETPEERGKVVGSSAVLGHRMTCRYAGVIADIRKFLTAEDYLDNEEALARILEETQEFVYDEVTGSTKRLAPGSEDLFLSMSGFFNVQHVYGYRPSQLIYGFNPNNTNEDYRLNALQCAELGVFAVYREEYQIAVEWLEMAEHLLSTWEDNEEFSIMQLNLAQQLLRFAIQQHNNAFHKPGLKEDWDTYLSFYSKPIKQRRKNIAMSDILYQKGYELAVDPKTAARSQFMHLCRGETLQSPQVQKNLKCFYERKRHPYLLINPIKVEHLAKNPPFFQLYEMIGNETIELMHKRYGNKVKPTKIGGKRDEVLPRWRTSRYKIFHPDDFPPQIFDLAEAATGLRVRNSKEIIQYTQYPEGTYFESHPDTLLGDAKPEDGYNQHDEWVATLLFQLEVAELGGSTALCQAGVTGRKVQGSALLWYNMYHNGTLRSDIFHGGCPVLQGTKTTLNRWNRYLDNWHNFKCTKNQWE